MAEEVEGLYSTISFVVDDRGFKKLEDYLFLATQTFSELNVKTEQYEDNLKRIATATREISGLKLPKIPKIEIKEPSTRQRTKPNKSQDPDVGALGRQSTRFNRPSQRNAPQMGGMLNFAGAQGLAKLGSKAKGITPLLMRLGAVGFALGAITLALKGTLKVFSKYAEKQAAVINQSQMLASSLGLQQNQVLGLADAYKTLGLDASNYFNSVRAVAGVQAGLAVGQSPEQQLINLAVAGVGGGAGALLSGDTDKLIELIGIQVKNLEAMGENGKRQLAVLTTNFPELVKEAKARELSLTQTGETPEQRKNRLNAIRFADVEGGEGALAKASAQLNKALQTTRAQFDRFANNIAEMVLPVLTGLVNWANDIVKAFQDFEYIKFFNKIIGFIKDFIVSLTQHLQELLASPFEKIAEVGNDVKEKIVEYVEPVKNIQTQGGYSLRDMSAYPYQPTNYQTTNANSQNNRNIKNDVYVNVYAGGADAKQVAEIVGSNLQKRLDETSNSDIPLGN